eukprot:690022-Prymnesium_polylepis.1
MSSPAASRPWPPSLCRSLRRHNHPSFQEGADASDIDNETYLGWWGDAVMFDASNHGCRDPQPRGPPPRLPPARPSPT